MWHLPFDVKAGVNSVNLSSQDAASATRRSNFSGGIHAKHALGWICWPLVGRAQGHFLAALARALVGVATILIYEILAYGQPVPHNAEYFFLHGMKLVAGALGGFIAGWQASARTRAPVS